MLRKFGRVAPCCQQPLRVGCLTNPAELDALSVLLICTPWQILHKSRPFSDPLTIRQCPATFYTLTFRRLRQFGVCCSRLGGPHDCPPLEDRQMEWSPRHPSTSGADSQWIGQWLCRSRSRCIRVADLPKFPSAWCHGCQHVAGSLLGVVSGEINSVCANMTPSGVHPNSRTRPASCPKCACP